MTNVGKVADGREIRLRKRPRVGLLALTLELYERIDPRLRREREAWLRQTVLPALSAIADVHFSRALFRREDIDDAVATYEAENFDALLVVELSYSPSQNAIASLKRTRLPILIWNTQELHAVDFQYDGEKLMTNHGVHGTQDLCNCLVRNGVPFEYVTSHVSDPDGFMLLEDFFAAAAAASGLRACHLGLLGYPFPGMGDLALDTTHLAATLGCRWSIIPIEEYQRRAATACPRQVAALAEEYHRLYAVAESIAPIELEASLRAELALRSIIADYQLDAFSFQFLALGEDSRTITMPFAAASRLMAEGIGFAGEGDLIGAAGTWLLNRLKAPASFSEIFSIDFAGNGLFLSHMGEANASMARCDCQTPLVALEQPIMPTRAKQLVLVTSFQPGPATLCALTLGPCGRWRLIASRMEIQDFGPLVALKAPHCKVVNHRDVRDWLTAYAKAGGPHHHALCFGDARPRIRHLARLLDAEYFEI
jgi:L-arabinose isomerase